MLNIVCLVGNLVADPEMKNTDGGMEVVSFRLAVNRANKDRTADYFTCVAFGSSAKYLCQYGKKGSLTAIAGRLQTRKYENKNKVQVTVTEVICNDIHIYSRAGSND